MHPAPEQSKVGGTVLDGWRDGVERIQSCGSTRLLGRDSGHMSVRHRRVVVRIVGVRAILHGGHHGGQVTNGALISQDWERPTFVMSDLGEGRALRIVPGQSGYESEAPHHIENSFHRVAESSKMKRGVGCERNTTNTSRCCCPSFFVIASLRARAKRSIPHVC